MSVDIQTLTAYQCQRCFDARNAILEVAAAISQETGCPIGHCVVSALSTINVACGIDAPLSALLHEATINYMHKVDAALVKQLRDSAAAQILKLISALKEMPHVR